MFGCLVCASFHSTHWRFSQDMALHERGTQFLATPNCERQGLYHIHLESTKRVKMVAVVCYRTALILKTIHRFDLR